jgi:hypothetical protein
MGDDGRQRGSVALEIGAEVQDLNCEQGHNGYQQDGTANEQSHHQHFLLNRKIAKLLHEIDELCVTSPSRTRFRQFSVLTAGNWPPAG